MPKKILPSVYPLIGLQKTVCLSQVPVYKHRYKRGWAKTSGFVSLIMAGLMSAMPLWVGVSFPTPSALAQTPDAQDYHANLLLNLGIRQHKTGQFTAALESLRRALMLYQN
ncbi:MAG TPA: tetratricopeptide repeat protein, partial [Stenomitos sp.]